MRHLPWAPPDAPHSRNPVRLSAARRGRPSPPSRQWVESLLSNVTVTGTPSRPTHLTARTAAPSVPDHETGETADDACPILPLLPGAPKLGYVPVEQRLRTRKCLTAANGKARAGDNSGSRELMLLLQNTTGLEMVARTCLARSRGRKRGDMAAA